MYMVVQKAWPFCSTANILKMPALICMILGQLGAFCYQDNNIYFAKGLVHQKADTREGLVHQKGWYTRRAKAQAHLSWQPY